MDDSFEDDIVARLIAQQTSELAELGNFLEKEQVVRPLVLEYTPDKRNVTPSKPVQLVELNSGHRHTEDRFNSERKYSAQDVIDDNEQIKHWQYEWSRQQQRELANREQDEQLLQLQQEQQQQQQLQQKEQGQQQQLEQLQQQQQQEKQHLQQRQQQQQQQQLHSYEPEVNKSATSSLDQSAEVARLQSLLAEEEAKRKGAETALCEAYDNMEQDRKKALAAAAAHRAEADALRANCAAFQDLRAALDAKTLENNTLVAREQASKRELEALRRETAELHRARVNDASQASASRRAAEDAASQALRSERRRAEAKLGAATLRAEQAEQARAVLEAELETAKQQARRAREEARAAAAAAETKEEAARVAAAAELATLTAQVTAELQRMKPDAQPQQQLEEGQQHQQRSLNVGHAADDEINGVSQEPLAAVAERAAIAERALSERNRRREAAARAKKENTNKTHSHLVDRHNHHHSGTGTRDEEEEDEEETNSEDEAGEGDASMRALQQLVAEQDEALLRLSHHRPMPPPPPAQGAVDAAAAAVTAAMMPAAPLASPLPPPPPSHLSAPSVPPPQYSHRVHVEKEQLSPNPVARTRQRISPMSASKRLAGSSECSNRPISGHVTTTACPGSSNNSSSGANVSSVGEGNGGAVPPAAVPGAADVATLIRARWCAASYRGAGLTWVDLLQTQTHGRVAAHHAAQGLFRGALAITEAELSNSVLESLFDTQFDADASGSISAQRLLAYLEGQEADSVSMPSLRDNANIVPAAHSQAPTGNASSAYGAPNQEVTNASLHHSAALLCQQPWPQPLAPPLTQQPPLQHQEVRGQQQVPQQQLPQPAPSKWWPSNGQANHFSSSPPPPQPPKYLPPPVPPVPPASYSALHSALSQSSSSRSTVHPREDSRPTNDHIRSSRGQDHAASADTSEQVAAEKVVRMNLPLEETSNDFEVEINDGNNDAECDSSAEAGDVNTFVDEANYEDAGHYQDTSRTESTAGGHNTHGAGSNSMAETSSYTQPKQTAALASTAASTSAEPKKRVAISKKGTKTTIKAKTKATGMPGKGPKTVAADASGASASAAYVPRATAPLAAKPHPSAAAAAAAAPSSTTTSVAPVGQRKRAGKSTAPSVVVQVPLSTPSISGRGLEATTAAATAARRRAGAQPRVLMPVTVNHQSSVSGVDDDLVDLSASFASLHGDEGHRVAADVLAGHSETTATVRHSNVRRQEAESVSASILNSGRPTKAPRSKRSVTTEQRAHQRPSTKGDGRARVQARGAGGGWR